MNSPEISHTEEDEISLIDLLIVLLKYRRLILGITLAALVVAVGGYFWYPAYQYHNAQDSRLYEAHLRVGPAPVMSSLEVSYNLQEQFKNTPMLLNALLEAGYQEFGYDHELQISLTSAEQRARALFVVRQRLIKNESLDGDSLNADKQLFFVESVNGEDRTVELLYKADTPERAQAFLEALYQQVNAGLVQTLRPLAESVVSSYERLLALENPGEVLADKIVEDSFRYDQAKELLAGEAPALEPLDDTYVVAPEVRLENFQSSFIVKGVVLVLAALFLSIFLAFVLNAFAQVRSDQESMEKIHAALGREARGKKPGSHDVRDKNITTQGRA